MITRHIKHLFQVRARDLQVEARDSFHSFQEVSLQKWLSKERKNHDRRSVAQPLCRPTLGSISSF
jgi:hypothetical protein